MSWSRKTSFAGGRVLEIGPKFGYHTRWIDRNLAPRYLGLLDLAEDVDHSYAEELTCDYELTWGNFISEPDLARGGPCDVIFFTGVLYHNVEPFRMWENCGSSRGRERCSCSRALSILGSAAPSIRGPRSSASGGTPDERGTTRFRTYRRCS